MCQTIPRSMAFRVCFCATVFRQSSFRPQNFLWPLVARKMNTKPMVSPDHILLWRFPNLTPCLPSKPARACVQGIPGGDFAGNIEYPSWPDKQNCFTLPSTAEQTQPPGCPQVLCKYPTLVHTFLADRSPSQFNTPRPSGIPSSNHFATHPPPRFRMTTLSTSFSLSLAGIARSFGSPPSATLPEPRCAQVPHPISFPAHFLVS